MCRSPRYARRRWQETLTRKPCITAGRRAVIWALAGHLGSLGMAYWMVACSVYLYIAVLGANVRICRIQCEAESGRLVTVTRVKVVWVSIHLVLEDAIRGSTRCMADDEHAPTGNIDPDGIGLVGGSFADWLALPAAGSPPWLPTHRGHLQLLTGTFSPASNPSRSYG